MHKFLHKVYTKCAKLVDEKNDRLFCWVRVRDFEPKLLIKGVHMYYYESKKAKKKRICHHTPFYSIFNMSSCRKPEIQNDLPKIT